MGNFSLIGQAFLLAQGFFLRTCSFARFFNNGVANMIWVVVTQLKI